MDMVFCRQNVMTYVNNFIFMCENLLSVVVRKKTNIPMFWFYYKLRVIYTNHHIYVYIEV